MLECDGFLKENLLGHVSVVTKLSAFVKSTIFTWKNNWQIELWLSDLVFYWHFKKKLSKLACHFKEKTVLAFVAPW